MKIGFFVTDKDGKKTIETNPLLNHFIENERSIDFVICDEAHRLRNVHKNGSKMANALYELTNYILLNFCSEDVISFSLF